MSPSCTPGPRDLVRQWGDLVPLLALPVLCSAGSFIIPDSLGVPPTFKVHPEPKTHSAPGSLFVVSESIFCESGGRRGCPCSLALLAMRWQGSIRQLEPCPCCRVSALLWGGAEPALGSLCVCVCVCVGAPGLFQAGPSAFSAWLGGLSSLDKQHLGSWPVGYCFQEVLPHLDRER